MGESLKSVGAITLFVEGPQRAKAFYASVFEVDAVFEDWVEDADAAAPTSAEPGVSIVNGPLDRPWEMRTAALLAPDGYVWEVAAEVCSRETERRRRVT
jgi:catechol 2,3-dioxygenase-like lactoylglutathione lyase family enzyme